jgi:hypothetical protein
MVEYVRGSEYDKWHWCKNCTQYPMYIYQKTSVKPFSDFCDQCKLKEEDGICQCEELNRAAPERGLKREIADSSYNIL